MDFTTSPISNKTKISTIAMKKTPIDEMKVRERAEQEKQYLEQKYSKIKRRVYICINSRKIRFTYYSLEI